MKRASIKDHESLLKIFVILLKYDMISKDIIAVS
jgi:hypothetical protein